MELLISLLFALIVALIVLWLTSVVVENLPLPPMVRNLIIALVALLMLVYFVQRAGLVAL